MNIIKLKDVVMPSTNPDAELFNTKLKGKYAYWVAMKYVISFGDLTAGKYTVCERDIKNLTEPGAQCYGTPKINSMNADFMNNYVDQTITDYINSISIYKTQNNYTPDDDITLDELKKFRQWLALQLLSFDQDDYGIQQYVKYTENETHMLEYYANNMYNEVVKQLEIFGKSEASSYELTSTKCACSGSTNISSLYDSSLSVCDALGIYRTNIYNLMVDTFSQLEFWLNRDADATLFIEEFKKYVDNIIKAGLPLNINTQNDTRFIDCGCSQKEDKIGLNILTRLSECLGYIIDGEIEGHQNFMADAFKDWSTYLYESMYWV